MKKGYWVFSLILALSIAFLLSIGSVRAEHCTADGTDSNTGCVCGHSPSSALGYGQVIVGGVNYSCSNTAPDGICPEDFQDPVSHQNASCSSCADIDCTATVTGIIKEASTGNPVSKSVVISHPIKWDPNANLETNTTTFTDGTYTLTALTGQYYFSASKNGYDTQLLLVNVTRRATTTQNFMLTNGTCHSDCTNSYGRCNAQCDGISFSDGTCNFYNSTVKQLCDNRLPGTEVLLGQYDTTHGTFIQCCGNKGSSNPQINAPYQRYYTTASTDSSNLKDMIKIEKIARYNDIPVRLIIAYWQQ